MGGQPGSFQAMVESIEDLRTPPGHDLAGQGELDAFGGTNQEGGAELGFQGPDLPGESRLRYAQRDRGPAKSALARNRLEVPQMPQFHVPPPHAGEAWLSKK